MTKRTCASGCGHWGRIVINVAQLSLRELSLGNICTTLAFPLHDGLRLQTCLTSNQSISPLQAVSPAFRVIFWFRVVTGLTSRAIPRRRPSLAILSNQEHRVNYWAFTSNPVAV
jgi:hypothetical protein